MQEPIIVNAGKDIFAKKEGLSQIEIMGMHYYLNEYLTESYMWDEGRTPTASHYFDIAYADNQLNCCGDAPLPGAPAELVEIPVSHFYLTPNHCLMAVFFVGDEEKEVLVRIN